MIPSQILKQPDGSAVDVVPLGPGSILYRVRNFDLTNVNNSFAVATAGYSVGTLQVVDKTGTMSTGAITVAVSNEPTAADLAAHPDVSATFAAAGTKTGFPLEHHAVGAYVSAAQAIKVELYLVLKA